uniref:Immunity protein Imm33 domain-containing protein n=1 Tax=Marinomonas sp. (strain MWYL1) TaxID=400668 RepID=A6VVG2_MARMS
MYREEPDYEDDSGWRFTAGDETDEYMEDSDNSSYVSLGAVLREDDSILQLLEREVGVAFVKDENGNFIELDD